MLDRAIFAGRLLSESIRPADPFDSRVSHSVWNPPEFDSQA
jgi:hypothetical protein